MADFVQTDKPAERGLECHIDIERTGLWIRFSPALPDGPHKATTTELMAAGALMGIAGVLTGKGADDIMRALVKFERDTAGKVRRR